MVRDVFAPAHNSFQERYRLCERGDFGVGFRRFALIPAAHGYHIGNLWLYGLLVIESKKCLAKFIEQYPLEELEAS